MLFILNTKNAHRFQIQTPAVTAPFEISTLLMKRLIYKVADISFRDPNIQEFHDKMHSIDEMLIKKCVAYSKELFGKKMSKDVIH